MCVCVIYESAPIFYIPTSMCGDMPNRKRETFEILYFLSSNFMDNLPLLVYFNVLYGTRRTYIRKHIAEHNSSIRKTDCVRKAGGTTNHTQIM